jgi:hypothetical protein
MQNAKSKAVWFGFIAVIALSVLAAIGCNYEVPITSNPTSKVNEKLLGDWVSEDEKDSMKVRAFDDSLYVVVYNGDLFRAYHSDIGKTPFVTVQVIESKDRTFAYVSWQLSEDGKMLGLRSVSAEVIPEDTKDAATIRKLLESNLSNPKLLDEEERYVKQ